MSVLICKSAVIMANFTDLINYTIDLAMNGNLMCEHVCVIPDYNLWISVNFFCISLIFFSDFDFIFKFFNKRFKISKNDFEFYRLRIPITVLFLINFVFLFSYVYMEKATVALGLCIG